MTRDGQQFYHWNPSGQLQRITYGNSDFNWADRTEFVYNALAQRVGRKEFAAGSTLAYETETIGYIGLYPAIKKLAKPGQTDTITYIFGFGMMGVVNAVAGAKHFFSRDRMGSVHGVWNDAQQLNGYLDYSPYGDRITETTTIAVPVGYIGMDWHKRAELMLVKYRIMNPKTGRWLSREPLGEFENLNLYAYGYGDPLGSFDPDGLSTKGLNLPKPPWYVRAWDNLRNNIDSLGRALRGDYVATGSGGADDLASGLITAMDAIGSMRGFRKGPGPEKCMQNQSNVAQLYQLPHERGPASGPRSAGAMGNPKYANAPGVPLRPEKIYTGSKKHGVNWTEGSATAKATGKPQGQWAKGDLDFAGDMAGQLGKRQGDTFRLPTGSKSLVHTPDGGTMPATHIWVRNNGNGTFHGYPFAAP
jgi:RHS repeat-associated protein